MPFVFVHGVNTRLGKDYDRDARLRRSFLKEIVAPVVGISPDQEILTPYWGSEGIKFWKNLEVIPRVKNGGTEPLGTDTVLPPSLGIAVADKKLTSGDSIDDLAHKEPEVAIDLLWDLAASSAESNEDLEDLARAYRVALEKLAADPGKKWLAQTTAADLADDVFLQVRPPKGKETLGGTGLSGMLEEAAKRMVLGVPDALSLGAVAVARAPLTRMIATFIGDAFQYLSERGDGSAPGPIGRTVLAALLEGSARARQSGEPLVVISHSFGGEIVYDILTHYAEGTELEVDAWVTVGSQVGLFEEMSLLWTSPGRVRPHESVGNEALPAPRRAKQWINIIDANDVLGFLVLPVFTSNRPGGIKDCRYDTGFPVTGAHSGYFEWPSFYKRLAHRLAKEPA